MRRRDFILVFLSAVIASSTLFVVAITDFLRTAKAKEEQVQEAALRSELAEFILALRDDEGYPIVESARELSRAQRPLKPLITQKSYYTYFLTQANAPVLQSTSISWEPPRTCTLEYFNQVRVCISAVRNDPTGRYIYFSLRYPTDGVLRHTKGQPLTDGDLVTLTFLGQRSTSINLVFEAPQIAVSRFPSQQNRFRDIHDVTAFSADLRPTLLRGARGQAFEKEVVGADGKRIRTVTALGRIDSSLLLSTSDPGKWPNSDISALQVGISFKRHGVSVGTSVDPGTLGVALSSLEKLYISKILSGASLRIMRAGKARPSEEVVWWSDETIEKRPARDDWFQHFSDWWANKFVDLLWGHQNPIVVQQSMQGEAGYVVELMAKPVLLPEIAARAFMWLCIALALVVIVAIVCGKAMFDLLRISQIVYSMVARRTDAVELNDFTKRRDQVGSLARIFRLFISRDRARNARQISDLRRAESEREQRMIIEQDKVRSRQAVLDVIGHEIRSPLQSLISKAAEDGLNLPYDIERIRRAVDDWSLLSSVEGFKGSSIAVKRADIASFLSALARNLKEAGKPVVYFGKKDSVFATFDPIALDEVLANLLDNAYRYRREGTDIEVTLKELEGYVRIDVFNEGPQIPEDQVEKVFQYGISERATKDNYGIGLFVSRLYVVGMSGAMHAHNRGVGVAFIITLPIQS